MIRLLAWRAKWYSLRKSPKMAAKDLSKEPDIHRRSTSQLEALSGIILIAMCPGIITAYGSALFGPTEDSGISSFFSRLRRGICRRTEDVDKMVELVLFEKEHSRVWKELFGDSKASRQQTTLSCSREISRRIKESDRSLGAIARIIIEEITRFSGCDRACVKFPVDVRAHPGVARLVSGLQDCSYHRDPRALAMSKRNDPSGTAIKVVEHPRLAWLIRRWAIWFNIVHVSQDARRCTGSFKRLAQLPAVSL